jgi:hypothetical protein
MKSGFEKYLLVNDFGKFVAKQEGDVLDKGIKTLIREGSGDAPYWIRLNAIQGMASFTERADVKAFLNAQKEIEKNDSVKELINSMLK